MHNKIVNYSNNNKHFKALAFPHNDFELLKKFI